jgi:hypothetical protein
MNQSVSGNRVSFVVCPRCNYFDEPHEDANDCILFLRRYYHKLRSALEKEHQVAMERLDKDSEREIKAISEGKVIRHGNGICMI